MKPSIQCKLLGSFGLMLALMFVVFGIGFWGLNSVAGHTEEIVLEELPEDIGIRELEVLIAEQRATYEDFIITEKEHALVIIERETNAVHEHFNTLEAAFLRNGNDDELLELLYIVKDEYVRFLAAGDELINLVQSDAGDEDSHRQEEVVTV